MGLREVGAGERFEGLYRANVRGLLEYALRRVGRAEDAADVVAETMLVAWRRLDQVPEGAEARLWLYGVARNVLLNRRRGGHRRDRLGERLRREIGHLVEADHAVGVDAGVDVQRALATLSDDDREILQLTVWEELAPQEIATLLGLTPVAVRSRLRRARIRLREALDRGGRPLPEPGGHERHDEQPLVRKTGDHR